MAILDVSSVSILYTDSSSKSNMQHVVRLDQNQWAHAPTTTKRMKKNRKTSNEVYGRYEETSRKPVDPNREEKG